MVGRKEASMPQFVKVGTKTDFESLNTGKLVQVGRQNIAIFRAGGNFCAIENTYQHAGGPLAEGSIAGEVVTCPWHGSRFNVKTGALVGPPATHGVKSFPVRMTGNDVEVQID